MSRREDILSCTDVTIMDRSANTALPSSYSKTFPAFRAGAAVTHAAGLGGKGFIDFIEPHACVSAFVPKHGSKRTPPRIEHRLRLSSLCKSRGVDVTDKDRTVDSRQTGAELVQEILPPVCDLGVNRPGTEPGRMFVLDPQAQDPDGGGLGAAVHISSLANLTRQNTGKTALNTQKCMWLSLAGLKAGVSREELR